jgi:hypothetical protein
MAEVPEILKALEKLLPRRTRGKKPTRRRRS